MSDDVKRLTIRLDPYVIEMIDNLARHEFTTRSGLIRRAILTYARDPERLAVADPDSASTDKKYEYIKADYPYLDQSDTVMINLFYDLKMKGEVYGPESGSGRRQKQVEAGD